MDAAVHQILIDVILHIGDTALGALCVTPEILELLVDGADCKNLVCFQCRIVSLGFLRCNLEVMLQAAHPEEAADEACKIQDDHDREKDQIVQHGFLCSLTAHEQGHADTACQRCHEQKMAENLLAHLYTPPLSIGFQFASRSGPGRWLSGNGSSG